MTATDRSGTTRAGYVTLLGRPNAGKSTLLNRVVGQKLSIVTPKAQTTWQRVTGIRTADDAQMIFLDTPGLLDVKDLLQRSMLHEAAEAVRDADVLLVVLDATRGDELGGDGRERLLTEALEESDAPRLAAVNKVDASRDEDVRRLIVGARDRLRATPFPISAETGEGVDALLDAVRAELPASPWLYPEEEIASQPVRFFVAELVRETVFELYHEEIPWAVFAQVEEFREDQEPLYIAVTLHVERSSQKGILVGRGGSAVKELGRRSRLKIEHFLGRSVYLELWVKRLQGWRRKRSHLARLGVNLPRDDHAATP